jgi:hypothetical protein
MVGAAQEHVFHRQRHTEKCRRDACWNTYKSLKRISAAYPEPKYSLATLWFYGRNLSCSSMNFQINIHGKVIFIGVEIVK